MTTQTTMRTTLEAVMSAATRRTTMIRRRNIRGVKMAAVAALAAALVAEHVLHETNPGASVFT